MEYIFSNIIIDTEKFELRQNGDVIAVEPQIFDLLLYFVTHPNTVFSRDDLMKSVWKEKIVSDATISSAIKVARKCIGDDGTTQKYIKTVHGRGFQFIGNIEKKQNINNAYKINNKNKNHTNFPEISLLILPFQLLSGLKENNTLSVAVASDIERLLTRVPLLNISSESYHYSQMKLRPTARKIYEEIGVTYLVDGNFRYSGSALSVNVQLSDNKSGFRIWSDEFSYDTKNPNDINLLNQLVIDIVAKLEPQLNKSILQKITTSNAPNNSRSLYLHANSLLALKGWRAETFLEANKLLKESALLDSNFALAPALQSLLLAFGCRIGLLVHQKNFIDDVIKSANRALELDNLDSTILGFSGCAFCDIGILDRGISLLNNAIRINSANGQAWVALGAAKLLEKNFEEGIEKLEHGINISALDSRLSVWRSILSIAYLKTNIEQSINQATTACEEDNRLYMPRVVLAGAKLLSSNVSGAKVTLEEAYRIKKDLSNVEVIGLLGEKLGNKLLHLRQ